LARFFPHYHLKNQKMSVVRRFISIFVLASLPFATNASFAYTFPYDTSAPSILKTPPTGTGFSTAARNQMFLTDNFEGYNIVGGFYTTPSTPWVIGQDVVVSDIPFVEGEVYWNSQFNTWVDNGVRYFTGNYDLYMAVPANPVYSNTPTAIGELTFAIATQTGATFHVNLALTNDPNPFADPIAGLPMDLCWGHPVHMQYHYHGYSWKCFPNQGNANEHSPQFGIALDGFGVFGPRGDGGVLLTNNDLDVCHGHSGKIDWDGILTDMYHYHLNNEFPYGPGCFRGTQIGVFSSNAKTLGST